jgi:hypothetical protein
MYNRNDNLLDTLGPLFARMEETRPRIKRRVLKKGIDYAIQRKSGYDQGVSEAFESPFGKNLINDAKKQTADVMTKYARAHIGEVKNEFRKSMATATRDRIVRLLAKFRGNDGFQREHATFKLKRDAKGNRIPQEFRTGGEGFLIRSAKSGLPMMFLPNRMELAKLIKTKADPDLTMKTKATMAQKALAELETSTLEQYISKDFDAIEDWKKGIVSVREKRKTIRQYHENIKALHKANKVMMQKIRDDPQHWEKKLAAIEDEETRKHVAARGYFHLPPTERFNVDNTNPYELVGYIKLKPDDPEYKKVYISKISRMPYDKIADDIFMKSDINLEELENKIDRLIAKPEELVPEVVPDIELSITKYQEGVKKMLKDTVPTGLPQLPKRPVPKIETVPVLAKIVPLRRFPIKARPLKPGEEEAEPTREDRLIDEYNALIKYLERKDISEKERKDAEEEIAELDFDITREQNKRMTLEDNIAASDEVEEEKELEAAEIGKRI